MSQFESKQDLIDALLTSCHIPLYANGTLTRNFRGAAAMDGGIFNFLPVPPGADYATRVCCFPSKNFTIVRLHSPEALLARAPVCCGVHAYMPCIHTLAAIPQYGAYTSAQSL